MRVFYSERKFYRLLSLVYRTPILLQYEQSRTSEHF